MEPSDEEIVRQTFANKEAFGLLIERYERKLVRYLERLGVSRREDQEDILQNAFIKAYRNLASFDAALTFSSWMYRIAHNEAMSFFRARRVRPQIFLSEEAESLLVELEDESADASAQADERLRREGLAKALATLSPPYRTVLTLRYFESRSYAEMSDILELPLGTVSTLIRRAKRALRRELEKHPL